MTGSDSAREGTEEQGLVVERTFNAPRELVWRAWTEPEHFMRWYGPKGFTMPTCEIDFRVGGRHVFGLRSTDGWDYTTTGMYLEIVPFERFVATDAFADGQGDVVETTVTVTFEDLGGGRTKLTLRQTGWSDDSMAGPASVGWNQAFDKLAAALAGV